MTGPTCDMCSGYGEIIQLSDGRPVHCPKCFGSSKPAPPANRPPAEIPERKQRKQRDRRRDKNPGKLRRALGSLWKRIFEP